MAVTQKILLLAGPLLLLLLVAVAGYATSQIRYLALPIPQALALFTVVLPLITGVFTYLSHGLVRRLSKNDQFSLTLPLVGVMAFQLMYETVVGTLALTYMLPPKSLRCGLDGQWQELWRHKDGDKIRVIQDALNCCGFNTVKDRSWPFGNPSACSTSGRTQACFGPLRKAEQINAGLLLLVAIVVFLTKVLAITSLLTNAPWTQTRWARPFQRFADGDDSEDNRATMRRLIEESAADGGYRDEPVVDSASALEAPPVNGLNGQGPRIQPSQLGESGNEWRDEERGH